MAIRGQSWMAPSAHAQRTRHRWSFSAAFSAWRRRILESLVPPARVVAAVVAWAAVAFVLAAGVRDATAARVPVAPPTTPFEPATLSICFASDFAPALPGSFALALEGFAGLRDHVFRCRAAAGQQATDSSGRNRLEQPAPPAAGGTQLEERIERLAVHAVSPFGVHRHPSVIHRHAPRR
jgi:hypothetical protein